MRREVLGALISVLIIWVITVVLVYAAIERVITMEFTVDADIMIIVAAVGVVMNIILGIVLHSSGGSHGHSHGALGGGRPHTDSVSSGLSNHSHGTSNTQIQITDDHNTNGLANNNSNAPHGPNSSRAVALPAAAGNNPGGHGHSHNLDNINIRAAFIHVIGDLLQSIGVLIAAYIIRYYPEYKIADPICTFLFSVLVVFTTVPIIRDLGRVLMEGVPPGVDYEAVCSHLTALPGVKMVHSLHVWALTVDKNACSVHLAVSADCDPDSVLQAAQRVIRNRHHIYHTTIQVEGYNSLLMDNCNQCQPLP